MFAILRHVSFDFWRPVFSVGFWPSHPILAGMPVPEAAAQIDNFPQLWEYKIWTLRQISDVQSVSVSSVEIKPATNGRNDPASQSCVRCFEQRGIFLSNKPDSNDLQWAWLKEKCRLTPIMVAGSFRPSLAGFK
jgi:hypothetical protein